MITGPMRSLLAYSLFAFWISSSFAGMVAGARVDADTYSSQAAATSRCGKRPNRKSRPGIRKSVRAARLAHRMFQDTPSGGGFDSISALEVVCSRSRGRVSFRENCGAVADLIASRSR